MKVCPDRVRFVKQKIQWLQITRLSLMIYVGYVSQRLMQDFLVLLVRIIEDVFLIVELLTRVGRILLRVRTRTMSVELCFSFAPRQAR